MESLDGVFASKIQANVYRRETFAEESVENFLVAIQLDLLTKRTFAMGVFDSDDVPCHFTICSSKRSRNTDRKR